MEKGDAKVSTGTLVIGAADPLPLRILIVGNFDGTDISNSQNAEHPVNYETYPTLRSIDSTNLNAYFASLNIDTNIHLEDFFNEDTVDASIRFKPHCIEDFSPASLLESVPEFRALKIAREKIVALSDGKINEQQFIAELSPHQHIKPLRMLCQDVVELAARDTEQFGARQISNRYKCVSQAIDSIIDMEVSKFLHHPVIQELESQWRGLKFLTDRISKTQQIQIDCLNTSRSTLVPSFNHYVIDEPNEQPNQILYSLFVSTFTTDNTSGHLDELHKLAESAEMLQTPLLFSLGYEFFGLHIDEAAYSETNPIVQLQEDQYQQWNQLRNKTSARWLSALYNGFLLRNQYEPGMHKAAGVTERINRLSQYLWGNPVLLLTSLMIHSFESSSWTDNISGQEHGRIDNLPLITNLAYGEVESFQTLALPINAGQAEDYATLGITSISCTRDEDCAYIYYAPCLFSEVTRPVDTIQALANINNNLPYQMLFSRIAHQVQQHYEKLTQISDANILKSAVTTILQSLIASTGEGAILGVNVSDTDDESNQHIVSIRATTGNKVLSGSAIEFGILV